MPLGGGEEGEVGRKEENYSTTQKTVVSAKEGENQRPEQAKIACLKNAF